MTRLPIGGVPRTRVRRGPWRVSWLVAAVVAVAWPVVSAQSQRSPARTSATSPSFTADQATRGRALYATNCSSCHGSDLGNGEQRPLKGQNFMLYWQGRSVGALFDYIRTNMPPGRGGLLSADSYAQLVALILSENGVKPGPSPLPTSVEALRPLTLPQLVVGLGQPVGGTSGGLSANVTLPPWPAPPNPLKTLTPVTDAMLQRPPEGDWLTWRRTTDGLGFSPLTQVTKSNVNQLRLVWSYVLPPGPNAATPLVHDGVIFVHGYGDNVDALDAESGEPLWSYHRDLPEGIGPRTKRNMALYGDKLYLATSDEHFVALSAKTGAVVWDRPMDVGTSGGPLVVKGTVIQGVGRGPGGLYGGRGSVFAFGADRGEARWRFNVVPGPGEPGGDTWNGLPLEQRSGGAVWTTSYYDPELNLVFFGTANTYDTAPLARKSAKPGMTNDALYTNSTLALNPDTGKLVWYYQHVANDQWDLDWVFERQLVELSIDGRRTKVVVTAGKPGVVDVLEAATGRYVFSMDPGLQNVFTHIDPKTGFKTINTAIIPGGGQSQMICPSWDGAKNWIPGSLNPISKVLYMPLNEGCMDMYPVAPGERAPMSTGVRVSTRPRPDSDGKVGRMQAFDLQNRTTLWVARQRAPQTSGALSTAGGVVFAGALDRWFSAYDDATGEVLWKARLSDVPSTAPISYMVNGKQYVAMVVGFGTLHSVGFLPLVPEIRIPHIPSSAIHVFALP